MASLNLTIDDTDPAVRTVVGRYSDGRAFDVIKRYLEPDGDLSRSQAAVRLYTMLPTAQERERSQQLSDQPSKLCTLILDIAGQIAYSDQGQIRLARLLTHFTVCDRLAELYDEEYLPMYLRMLDYWDTIGKRFPWGVGEEIGKKNGVNTMAFLARLIAAGTIRVHGNYAVPTMRDSLENYHSPEWYSERVNAAAMWILCAGQSLFEGIVQCPRGVQPWEEEAWKNGPLYKGPVDGIERWKFWQKQFFAAVASAEINLEAKNNALKAASLMGSLARDCTWTTQEFGEKEA